jgi:hypothetical protein
MIVVSPYLKAIMICSIITIIMNLYTLVSAPVYLIRIESRAFEVKKIIAQFTQTLVRERISPIESQRPMPFAGRA